MPLPCPLATSEAKEADDREAAPRKSPGASEEHSFEGLPSAECLLAEQRRLWSVSESCGKKDVSLNGLQITECASAAMRGPSPRYERVAGVGSARKA